MTSHTAGKVAQNRTTSMPALGIFTTAMTSARTSASMIIGARYERIRYANQVGLKTGYWCARADQPARLTAMPCGSGRSWSIFSMEIFYAGLLI